MKVLFIIDNLASGGKERRLVELMKGLKSSSEVQFELVLMSNDVHYKEIFDLGIKIHFVIRKTRKDLNVFKTLYNLCKKIKPEIIHCWDSMTAIYSSLVCRMLSIKLVNGMVIDSPVKRNIFNKHWLRAKLTFPLSDIIVGNSMAGLKAYAAKKNKSKCVHNGFNFERIRKITPPDIIKSNFDINSRYIVIMVGEFSNRKDYDTYIKAANRICDKRNDIEFIAIGDGANFNAILEKIKPIHKDKIKLLGKQSKVESFINISDICVLTTNSKVHGEGISNSILEYMALGKPVIATSGGGTNEIVVDQKTGFLIEPQHPDELSEKIEVLLNDMDLRKKMGISGNDRITNLFSIDKMVENYIAIYGTLIFERGKKRERVKKIIKKYSNKLFIKGWSVGFSRTNLADIIRNKSFNPDIAWVPLKFDNRFFADPFLLITNDGNYNILLEDYDFRESYGKISLITFDKIFNLVQYKVLLDTKLHLSYPFIFKENDKVYVFPESSASGKLSCYEYNPFDKSLKLVKEILDLPILDPTILKYENKYWLFGTLSGKESARNLYIYISDSLLGPYTPHNQNPVKNSREDSRPAGNFIVVDGNIYRPSQNSEHQYGESIIINKIRALNEYYFVEEPYFSISINKRNKNNKGFESIHTINAIEDIIIVDGGTSVFSPLKKIRNLVSKKRYVSSLQEEV